MSYYIYLTDFAQNRKILSNLPYYISQILLKVFKSDQICHTKPHKFCSKSSNLIKSVILYLADFAQNRPICHTYPTASSQNCQKSDKLVTLYLKTLQKIHNVKKTDRYI